MIYFSLVNHSKKHHLEIFSPRILFDTRKSIRKKKVIRCLRFQNWMNLEDLFCVRVRLTLRLDCLFDPYLLATTTTHNYAQRSLTCPIKFHHAPDGHDGLDWIACGDHIRLFWYLDICVQVKHTLYFVY